MDVLQALRSLEGKGVFDCIFMDPPYNHELERQVLEYLQDSTILDENTLIIIEADLGYRFRICGGSWISAAAFQRI